MRQWTVDAFASRPFRAIPPAWSSRSTSGRPTAGCRRVANENNQAETAFLRRTRPTRRASACAGSRPGIGGRSVRPRHAGLGPCAARRTGPAGGRPDLRHPLRSADRPGAATGATRWTSRPTRRDAARCAPDGLGATRWASSRWRSGPGAIWSRCWPTRRRCRPCARHRAPWLASRARRARSDR